MKKHVILAFIGEVGTAGYKDLINYVEERPEWDTAYYTKDEIRRNIVENHITKLVNQDDVKRVDHDVYKLTKHGFDKLMYWKDKGILPDKYYGKNKAKIYPPK